MHAPIGASRDGQLQGPIVVVAFPEDRAQNPLELALDGAPLRLARPAEELSAVVLERELADQAGLDQLEKYHLGRV